MKPEGTAVILALLCIPGYLSLDPITYVTSLIRCVHVTSVLLWGGDGRATGTWWPPS